MILCVRTEACGLQRLQAWSFWSASFRDTQVLSMEALSLHHTRWSVRPSTWAANWAAASGERTVEQPRPAGRVEAASGWRRCTKWWWKRGCTHHWACGGTTRHPARPSRGWGAGSWWRGRPCFQTSPDRDRCFCQPQPQKLWLRHHLKWENTTWASPVLARRLPSTRLRIRLWCEASRLGLCAPRWLSGCRESRRSRRPSGFFHSGPCPRWIPSARQPCPWPGSPAAAETRFTSVGSRQVSILEKHPQTF